jgi:hypothetical protein
VLIVVPAFNAKEAVIAFIAQDDVPVRFPVKLPVKLPVLYEEVKALNEEVVTKEPVFVIEPDGPGNPWGPIGPCGPAVITSTIVVTG